VIESSSPKNIFGAQSKGVNPMSMTLQQKFYIDMDDHEEKKRGI